MSDILDSESVNGRKFNQGWHWCMRIVIFVIGFPYLKPASNLVGSFN